MCLSWALVKVCVCPSFPFAIESGMWDVIVFIPDHCLSIYFTTDLPKITNKNSSPTPIAKNIPDTMDIIIL